MRRFTTAFLLIIASPVAAQQSSYVPSHKLAEGKEIVAATGLTSPSSISCGAMPRGTQECLSS